MPFGIFAGAISDISHGVRFVFFLFHSLFQDFSHSRLQDSCSDPPVFVYRFSRDYSQSSSQGLYRKLFRNSGCSFGISITVAPEVPAKIFPEFIHGISPEMTYEIACAKFPEKYRKKSISKSCVKLHKDLFKKSRRSFGI